MKAASTAANITNRMHADSCAGVPWPASQVQASALSTEAWLSRLLKLLVLADAAQELHVVGEPRNLRQLRTGTLRTWLVRRRRPVAHGWLVFMNRFVNHKQVGAQMATPVRPAVTLHWAHPPTCSCPSAACRRARAEGRSGPWHTSLATMGS